MYISKIDLKQAFLQLSMEDSSKKYTIFSRGWDFGSSCEALRVDWESGHILTAGQLIIWPKGPNAGFRLLRRHIDRDGDFRRTLEVAAICAKQAGRRGTKSEQR